MSSKSKKTKKTEDKINIITCSYNEFGEPVDIDISTFVQIKLLGSHAEEKDAYMLISTHNIDVVCEYSWYMGKDGYPVTYGSVDGTKKFGVGFKLHKFLHPYLEKGLVIDHINRNRLDNRDENMRICTQKENSYNRTKSSNSKNKYKGVKKCGTTWTACITKDGKKTEITGIKDEESAAKIYDAMAEEMFGIFAGKNFTDVE